MTRKLALLISTLVLALSPIGLNAAELKVVDKFGLTRASKQVEQLATVEVVLKTSSGQAPADPIHMNNSEGLAPDATAYPEFGGKYSFHNIRPGTWQLVIGQGLDVVEVKIAK